LRCGSPGYVAPEVLNGLGYGVKADIFNAGIILCIMLTGVSPFSGRTYQEVLLKNKTENVNMTGAHWSYVSEEAKDLVSKMVARDPENRYTAMEALQHPWFSLEHTQNTNLSNAQENMKKYQAEGRFNVSKIKPEFSMGTYTPLFSPRFNNKGSPLILLRSVNERDKRNEVPDIFIRRREFEEKKAGVIIRDINEKYKYHKEALPSDSGDFDEDGMDEEPIGIEENIISKSFVFSKSSVSMTPATISNKQSLELFNTPSQNKKNTNIGKSVFYLQQLGRPKFKEEAKTKFNPFTSDVMSEYSTEQVEDRKEEEVETKKRESIPRFVARAFRRPKELIVKEKKVLTG